MGHNFKITIIVTLFCFFLAGCHTDDISKGKRKNFPPEATVTPEAIPVETDIVRLESISDYFETTSTIETESKVVVYPKISEQVTHILVEEGDFVHAGQVMATLDDEKLLLKVQQARVTRDQAKDTFLRTKQLYESQMTSKENFLNAKYNYENSEVSLKMAELDLAYSKIKAPISGIVTERFISIGDLVTLSTKLFVVIDPQKLIVHIHLPETERQLISVGMNAELYIDALPNKVFKAIVQRIQPIIDAKTGTVKVTLKLVSGFNSVSTGMFTRVRIKVREHMNTVIIPKKALLSENGGSYYVYIVSSHEQAEKREITTGIDDGERVEIITGLNPGDRLVVVGQENLKPGDSLLDLKAAPTPTSHVREHPSPPPDYVLPDTRNTPHPIS